jgi:hypothetical protein
MIGWRDDVALEGSGGKPAHQIDAAARGVGDRDAGVLLLEFVFDLRECGEEAARVTDVQLISRRLRSKCRDEYGRDERERDSQNATSIDAATVRGWPRCAV